MTRTPPHGSWPSPVTVDLVTAASVTLGEVRAGLADVWWAEQRPHEGGRVQVVRHTPGRGPIDVLPPGCSARSRVHEYGGGAWWVHDDVLFFVDGDDQRLHRLDPRADAVPEPLTPPPPRPGSDRYADGRVTIDARWVVCVRERHVDPGAGPLTTPRNELVAVPAHDGGDPHVLVGGRDFVAAPRPSPDGRHLAWLAWDQPAMPWDRTELWVAELDEGDGGLALRSPRRVAGGGPESLVQPGWDAEGRLLAVSDRSGWWNLFVFDLDGVGDPTPVAVVDGEIGTPPWVFDQQRWAQLSDGRVLVAVTRDGRDVLGVAAPDDPQVVVLDTPFTSVGSVTAFGHGAALVAATFSSEPEVVLADLPPEAAATFGTLRPARDLGLDARWFSVPEHLTVPTEPAAGDADGEAPVTHALVYPPTNPDVADPGGARPPLLLLAHGGPTAAARPQLNLAVQFWTSRGFAVADVNYRGSVGYGRPYREALAAGWGLVDVADCLAVVRELVRAGRVDGRRVAMRGSSAGGFTVLRAVAAGDDIAVATVAYGVVDLEQLQLETHKFESRYNDWLVAPWPEGRAEYAARSPLHDLEALDTPMLVLHGLEDEVVPPAQARLLVSALAERGVAHALLTFPHEQHGFRRAETIRRALEAELYVVGVVLGFEPADAIEPVEVVGTSPPR